MVVEPVKQGEIRANTYIRVLGSVNMGIYESGHKKRGFSIGSLDDGDFSVTHFIMRCDEF